MTDFREESLIKEKTCVSNEGNLLKNKRESVFNNIPSLLIEKNCWNNECKSKTSIANV